jgi:hypothetical protein
LRFYFGQNFRDRPQCHFSAPCNNRPSGREIPPSSPDKSNFSTPKIPIFLA